MKWANIYLVSTYKYYLEHIIFEETIMLAYPLACTSTHVGLSMGTLDKFFRCPLRLKKCAHSST